MKVDSPKPRIVIRAEGDAETGLGHIVRCLSLAEKLREEYEITFATTSYDGYAGTLISGSGFELLPLSQDELHASAFIRYLGSAQLVVLDGYSFTEEDELVLRNLGYKVLTIDDLVNRHYSAHVVLNIAPVDPGTYQIAKGTRVFTGPKYALLRPAFLESMVKPVRPRGIVRNVLISFGGTDAAGLNAEVCARVRKNIPHARVVVVTTQANPKLAALQEMAARDEQIELYVNADEYELVALLKSADLAVVSASGIAYEACAARTPFFAVLTAPNQQNLYDFLVREGLVLAPVPHPEDIDNLLQNYAEIPPAWESILERQRHWFDNGSGAGFLSMMRELELLQLSPATHDDAELFFQWANDPDVRRNSYSQKPITAEEHFPWFERRMSDPGSFIYLFMLLDGTAVGHVRFQDTGNELITGIVVDPNFRGKGIAVTQLRMAVDEVQKSCPGKQITAWVKKENEASRKAFLRAGFKEEGIFLQEGIESYKFIL